MTDPSGSRSIALRARLLILLLAGLLGAGSGCAVESPWKVSPTVVSVPPTGATTKMFAYGLTPAVVVPVNGTVGLMMVDTGAFAMLLSPEFATTVGTPIVPTSGFYLVDAGGNQHEPLGTMQVRSMLVGGANLGGFEAIVSRLDIRPTAYTPPVAATETTQKQKRKLNRLDGVLGLPVFSDVLLTLDYAGQTVSVASGELPSPNLDPSVVQGRMNGGQIEIPLDFAGREVYAMLDTGMSEQILLPSRVLAKLPGASSRTAGGTVRYWHGTGNLDIARVEADVRVAGQTFHRPVVSTLDAPRAIVGTQFLRHFVVTIDQKNQRVRLARASKTPIQSLPVVRMGFEMNPQTGVVNRVDLTSAADRAGLRVGDVVELMEGMPVRQFVMMTDDQFMSLKTIRVKVRRAGQTLVVTVPVEKVLE